MYNITAGQIVEQGRVLKNVVDRVDWKFCNGILVPGFSGSGKTNSAVFYMSQYAAQGVKLIVCDYFGGIGETLLNQISHLEGAFLWPPVTEGEDIVNYIERIREVVDARYRGIDTDRTPILFVIDEFTSFLTKTDIPSITIKTRDGGTTTKINKATYMEEFVATLTTARKVDVRFMVLGQDWAQTGTTSALAKFRRQFSDVVFHRLLPDDAERFTTDPFVRKQIEGLRAGFAIHNGRMIRIPLVTKEYRDYTERKIAEFRPVRSTSDNELLSKLLLGEVLPEREVVREAHWKAVEAIPKHSIIRANPPKESTVEVLPRAEVVRQEVAQTVPAPLTEIIARIKRGESNYKIAKEMYQVTGGRRSQILNSAIDKIRRKING